MNTINIQAYAWISGSMGTTDHQNQTLSQPVRAGATIHDLFSELAQKYPDFKEKVFDPHSDKFSDQVMVIVNGRLIQYREFKTSVINDKDKIILSPVLVGG
ncbi:MAG TPA: MoaD/ThiS family protein [Dehalococcoidales bacterium]|nr:MoaD/ThiS family protein [Dehalococcoidales bacterium]